MVEAMEVEKAPATTQERSGPTMIFNISIANWIRIISKLLFLYACLAAYFAVLFVIGLGVRQQDYFTLPSKYFGDFGRNYKYRGFYNQLEPVYQNLPKGCDMTEKLTFSAEESYDLTICSGKNNTAWNVFPWVEMTKGLGSQPDSMSCYTGNRDYLAITTGGSEQYDQYPAFCGNEINYRNAAEKIGYNIPAYMKIR